MFTSFMKYSYSSTLLVLKKSDESGTGSLKKVMVKLIRSVTAMMLLVMPLIGYAQNFEPEFIGECNLLSINGTDTISTPLQKTKAFIKAKAGASLYLTGIGSVKTRIYMEGITSNCVSTAKQEQIITVKVSDNNIDPNSFIEILKFEVKGKERRCEIGKVNTFGGSSVGNSSNIDYKAKLYGKKSFAIYITPEPGEYAIKITNPNQKDEKIMMLYCFTEQ